MGGKIAKSNKKAAVNYDLGNNSVESIDDYGIEVEDKYRGSLVITKDFNGKFIYKRRKNLKFSDRILNIKNELNLEDKHIIGIWKQFKSLDPNSIGYIKLDTIYNLIGESPSYSSMSVIVDRFFITIEKEFSDKVNFEELLPFLVSYCLYSTKQLIKFVFNFIDSDGDNFISRYQIVDYLSNKREGEYINLINHKEAIKFTNFISRSDKINLEEFEALCLRFPFIYYQAHYFQTKLRENYISERFWKSCLKNTVDKQVDKMKMIERQKLKNKIEEIQLNIVQDKIKNYIHKKELEAKKNIKNDMIYEEEIRVRATKKFNNDEIFYKKFVKPYNNFANEKKDLVKSLDNIMITHDLDLNIK